MTSYKVIEKLITLIYNRITSLIQMEESFC